jgi:hypothetical protein
MAATQKIESAPSSSQIAARRTPTHGPYASGRVPPDSGGLT